MLALNIRQLQYLCEIMKQGCNISAAAVTLHTSQSGISKQLKLLEDELGARLFHRQGNRLSGLTSVGERVFDSARRVVHEVSYIKGIAGETRDHSSGTLVIATTHTQARYVLPAVVKTFSELYPKVGVTLRHADSTGIIKLVSENEADIGIVTNPRTDDTDLISLPCQETGRIAVVPKGHALLRKRQMSLQLLCRYPIVTYDAGFSGRDEVLKTFERANLTPRIVLSASDADVIKSCVELGLGIAVLQAVVYDPARDKGLKAIPVGRLFPPSKLSVVFHRRHYFRKFDYDFIEMLSKRWDKAKVQRAIP